MQDTVRNRKEEEGRGGREREVESKAAVINLDRNRRTSSFFNVATIVVGAVDKG